MKTLITVLGLLALVGILGLVFAFPLMLLINYVFSPGTLIAIFGVAKLGFWKTYALGLVTSMLFKSNTVNNS